MTWVLDNNKQVNMAYVVDYVYDGSALWVLNTTDIRIVLEYLNDPGVIATIDISSYLGGKTPINIVKLNNYICVAAGADASGVKTGKVVQRIILFDVDTYEYQQTIIPPINGHSNLEAAWDKLWLVEEAAEDDTDPEVQTLYYTDITGSPISWITTTLPQIKQYSPRVIHYGKEGFIWISNHNNSSLTKINAETGVEITTITVNRKPQNLYTNEDKELYVYSFEGMVSEINQTTNAVTNVANTYREAKEGGHSGCKEGVYHWIISDTEPLLRADFNGSPLFDNIRGINAEEDDFSIENFDVTTPIRIGTIFGRNWYRWTGGSPLYELETEIDRIVLLHDTIVHLFPDIPMLRESSYQVRITAMVATGSKEYYGETE